tara:strand:- start:227 stop:484 length:258 start_codon:yes stop_codon:yes gene_type:complete
MKNKDKKLPFEQAVDNAIDAKTNLLTSIIFTRMVKKMLSIDAEIDQMENGIMKKVRLERQEKAWTNLLESKKFDCIRITDERQAH